MNINYKITSLLLVVSFFGFSQERTKDTIDDQKINVIKPYTPTISDAFKIKDKPSLEDANTIKKKEVKYNIFSIPVASTFTPAKGRAAKVDKAKPIKLYDNYASLGVGSYTTILGEVYLNHELSSGENVGGYFSHHSSQGEIDGVLLDNNFSKTGLNVNYSKKLNDFSWKLDLGADLMTYNWYGLPQQFFGPTEAATIDPKIRYNSFYVGGKLNFDDAIIKNGSVRFRRFGDDRDSGENRFVAKTEFDVPIQDEIIATKLRVDYIGGNFERNYITTSGIDYGNVNVSLAPSYQIKQDDLTVDLGIQLTYLNDTEMSDNKLFLYPNIEATYRLVNDILIGYAGVKGDLIQNSYYDFVNENPFVSPTLLVTPTDQQYHGFIGLKGKLSNSVSYNIKGNYFAEESKPLFKANDAQSFATEDYQFGNSFNVVYDNVKTFSVAGELNIDVNRNFKLAIKGEYFNYNTDNEAEAWNLPNVTGSVFLDYQISEKWYMGGSLFFTGERMDESVLLGTLLPPQRTMITLDSFFDANAHLGYNVTDYLSVFGKVNNIANQDYQRWQNFPVQGIQFLAGATYQFDF
ncbi:MAG: TonB-dependent receptor [Winogradskyella sp.]|uniref:TonB-dependent receptor n=1 Tax=Winogradskyella sp. TaxID=1883156 RepID=UPI000F3F4A07|nr:TonB-dependent receptor [Winogradskyella sp.]RNC84981.1 MAG: TonB-dependent receptor [Winogradskyella sp.]